MNDSTMRNAFLSKNSQIERLYNDLLRIKFYNTEFDNSAKSTKTFSFDQRKKLPVPFVGSTYTNEIMVSIHVKSGTITWWFEWNNELNDSMSSGLHHRLSSLFLSYNAKEDESMTQAAEPKPSISELSASLQDYTEA